MKSGYDLGYIFGTFLGDGNSHISKHKGSEIGSCHWSFGIHETDIANKLQECIKNAGFKPQLRSQLYKEREMPMMEEQFINY